jgi:hypothetical protein
MNFKQFLESKKPEELDSTLNKLPSKVRNLIKGYKISFTPESTLKTDKQHVGIVDKDKKTITICAGFYYSRELELLHEIGHMFFETLKQNQKQNWKQIVKNTKQKQHQNPEELFCFAFANHYAKMKVNIHNHPEWSKFIDSIVKQ